ncbi:hypothetical protein ASC94_10715 [Massilia sp. Root418]|uniref:antibiotic biosynthesis monooxygenase n=1 Tax=Massilia sp. Root418 TaxID=1736532 RepID=UPI0006FD4056|nr:antibiotic biosynthesis monooxygenase [Massilia sp. Root418]KQW93145.1 hypothetical protein ASC94_10715 [Massilia sp. Root418]
MHSIAAEGTSVIVHDVAPAHHASYESWMLTAREASRGFKGYLATDVIKPVGAGLRYVVILRFSSSADAEGWLQSDVRAALLKDVERWLIRADRYQVQDNSEFWFVTPSARATPPKRWKQWLLSTVAVFPLTAVIPASVATLAHNLAPTLPKVTVLAATAAIISAIMVYWLMPLLSRFTADWLGR